MNIWIDADGCPKDIKEIVFRAGRRLGLPVFVVANRPLAVPRSGLVTMVQVSGDFDATDQAIVDRVVPGDVVITADVPLASQVVDKGAVAIDPRGQCYTDENVGERLSLRNFFHDLRGAGLASGGSGPLTESDRRRFASALDRALTRRLKSHGRDHP
ncbi:YaiI/YqxD family protein [Desulfacinum hydrothermale]|uniref:YaiI/YqxD family protein n=1 Tax=Desulfacinum hydrothermale TaxID=109258 RepID=UPI0009FDC84F|nr:YaiI/YqxD family protein [Desulfacinum hydrothermale]